LNAKTNPRGLKGALPLQKKKTSPLSLKKERGARGERLLPLPNITYNLTKELSHDY
jgi:hypothetical protein